MLWLCLCFVFIVLARSYKVKLVNQKSKIEKTINVEANELILAKGEDVMDLPSQCGGGICNSSGAPSAQQPCDEKKMFV